MNRVGRVERVTKEIDGPRRDRPRRHRADRHRHRRAVLRPHAGPARQARRVRPDRARRGRPRHRRPPHGRGHRARARRRRCARRWATSGASAGSATPGSPWTSRSRRPPSTSPAGPTSCTPQPEFMRPMIGGYDTTVLPGTSWSRWPSTASSPCTCACCTGRNAHHIVEASSRRSPGPCGRPTELDPRGSGSSRPRRARCSRDGSSTVVLIVVGLFGAQVGGAPFLRQMQSAAARALPRASASRPSGACAVRRGRPAARGSSIVRSAAGSWSSTTASGNLRSAERALAPGGRRRRRSPRDSTAAMDADGLVVPGVGRVRRLHGGPARGRRAEHHRPPAGRRPPGAGHLRRHADPVRPRRRARRAHRGLRTVARHRRAAQGGRCCRTWAGTRSPRRRARRCSPAWTPAPASTSCTPTPCALGAGGVDGDAPAAR